MITIRTTVSTVFAAMLLVFSATDSARADDPVSIVLNGCGAELKTYCSQVTPGDGRLLSCLEAHSDKVSGQCAQSVYRAAFFVEAMALAIEYVGIACIQDIVMHCPAVEPGDDRILDCLDKKKENVSGFCRTALKDMDAID